MDKINAVVYYHAHCNDGFGAAWAFYRYAEQAYANVDYVPMQYGDPFPEPAKFGIAECFLLDFSASKSVLCDLSVWYTNVIVIDHHKTAMEELNHWDNSPDNVELFLRSNRSGAMLTYEYFNTREVEIPPLLAYIQDRDLWKHALQYTKEINARIAFANYSFIEYDILNRNLIYKFTVVVEAGRLLLEQHKKHCAAIVESTARPITFMSLDGTKEWKGLVCNCPGQFASDVGHILATQSGTFGATYFQDKNENVKFSLRSNGYYDVTEIAKQFGGGGHKNAAGFLMRETNPIGNGVTIWSIPDAS